MVPAMRIVVTGGSGFVGRQLAERLLAAGHQLHLLGRAPKKGLPAAAEFSPWDPLAGTPPKTVIEGSDAVIHLAGEPLAQRWTEEAKRRIQTSRTVGTANLVSGIAQTEQKPKILISASAIGYYGDRGDEELKESSAPGKGFLADLCRDWEAAALTAKPLGLRVVLLRTGIVLGAKGGALERMLPPFKFGLGGRIGSGEHWMSWIHADDAVGLIEFALQQQSITGPLNLTAPNPVKNTEFTAALGKALSRPAILPIPVAALRLLFGEMSQILVTSQRVLPSAALKARYQFRYSHLGSALQQILASGAQ